MKFTNFTKNTKCIVFSAVLLFCLSVGSASQAEEMYQISESELTTLETNLDELTKSNATKQQLLTEQKTQLTEASQQLDTVKKELIVSKNLNEATQKSLERANQSLTELEKEAKKKIRVKTRQRDLWIAISGGLLYAWIKK